MNDEFESLNSRIPDFNSAIVQRLQSKNTNSSLPPPGTVDPYKLMLQKKRQVETGDIPPESIVKWPDEDVKALKDYCTKMGIYGYSTRLHPKIALAQLKKEFGDDYTGIPLDERIPSGYERLGNKQSYNPNNTYSDVMRKKQILHG